MQKSYNTIEGYTPKVLPVGTKVVYTNDYGISFIDRVITRVEQDEKGELYYFEPNDADWIGHRRESLTVQYT